VFSADLSHLDYFALVREHRRLDAKGKTPIKVAVLAEFASQKYCEMLRVLFARSGFDAQLYEADYDTIELEAFNAESGLYAFGPDVVLVVPSTNALRYKYFQDTDAREDFADRVAARFANVWSAIGSRTKAQIVQGNYTMPYERQFGNFDWKVPTSFYFQAQRLNTRLAELARSTNVLLDDIDAIASHVGRQSWCDEKLWTLAKALCSPEHLPRVAQNTIDVVLSTRGKGIKCLVLDLDNTLWGGIIGDDGLDGIAIGPFGEGEPFYRLQLFLREMKRRGIILCVASKNNHDTAFRVFKEHPEMVLREEDIAVFVANWEPKVEGIKAIKEVLNIGFDAMAFIDDNPFERNMVRQYLPDVVVPELPEEASDYVRALCDLNLFETTAFTAEDGQRTALYQEEAKRKLLEKSFANVDDYMRSLEMQITIAPFDTFHLPRIAQLIQRSNQFNLTTCRWGQSECEALMKADNTVPLYVRLADRFGDYGLISVVVMEIEGTDAKLPMWLMSCRVLSRGVEQHVMNRVIATAKAKGAKRVVGEYIPSAKNAMVKDFYKKFGFALVGETSSNGATQWAMDVDAYNPGTTFITDVPAKGAESTT
jgi:FkbH-like protein